MGDRGNVIFHQRGSNSPVYLYSHWYGSDLPKLVANALDTPPAKDRIGDGPYLTRILVSQILKQVDAEDEATGWGLATTECDNENPYVHVDTDTGGVALSRSTEKPEARTFDPPEVFVKKYGGLLR